MIAAGTPTRIHRADVVTRLPLWGLAWAAGFAIPGLLGLAITGFDVGFWIEPLAALSVGGFAGGVVAGSLTMWVLRHDARSLKSRLITASIWIWGIIATIVIPIVFAWAFSTAYSEVVTGSYDRSGSGIGIPVILAGELLVGGLAGLIAVSQVHRAGILTTLSETIGVVGAWAVGSVVGWSAILLAAFFRTG